MRRLAKKLKSNKIWKCVKSIRLVSRSKKTIKKQSVSFVDIPLPEIPGPWILEKASNSAHFLGGTMDLVIPGVQSMDGNSNNAMRTLSDQLVHYIRIRPCLTHATTKKSKRVRKCKFKLINNSAHLFKVDSK